MRKEFAVLVLPVFVASCGGGSGGTDPSPLKTTAAGPGSTVASAEVAVTGGAIRYTQYQMTSAPMSDKNWSPSSVSATVNFDPTSKRGSIQFPVLGGAESISTVDAYATVSWSGPYSFGTYRLSGNVLMSCNASAATYVDTTQVFVSTSLERLKDGAVDDLAGMSFDMFDCSLLMQSKAEALKVNADGSLYMSIANTTLPKNQAFDMLNPEKFPAIAIATANANTDGFYSGHAFRYSVNGVNKYAIVIQTNAAFYHMNDPKLGNGGNPYHYFLAVQR